MIITRLFSTGLLFSYNLLSVTFCQRLRFLTKLKIKIGYLPNYTKIAEQFWAKSTLYEKFNPCMAQGCHYGPVFQYPAHTQPWIFRPQQ